ncbi:hypothetical protein ACF061_03820 [Streptomyces sp. NPDC015220]|uniref:hypothetical protein n=1 Tax=Streptomyces sp. NPDC015220 TaxID=3364947 RepID=UPI00370243CB
MAAERESHDGVDPLLAAILDEPLPRSAGAEDLAEYRAARADLATLRRQLTLVADALARPEPEPGAAAPAASPATPPGAGRPRGRGRRVRAVALGGLAAACVASAVLGLGRLTAQGGMGDGGAGAADRASSGKAAAGSPFGDPRYLACARLVVEGDVTRVTPEPEAGRQRVTLRVTRSYGPGTRRGEVAFTLAEPLDLAPGAHVLVGLPRHADEADAWLVGERRIAPERDRITRALPLSRSVTCGE